MVQGEKHFLNTIFVENCRTIKRKYHTNWTVECGVAYYKNVRQIYKLLSELHAILSVSCFFDIRLKIPILFYSLLPLSVPYKNVNFHEQTFNFDENYIHKTVVNDINNNNALELLPTHAFDEKMHSIKEGGRHRTNGIEKKLEM